MEVPDFYSTALGRKSLAKKWVSVGGMWSVRLTSANVSFLRTTRFATFPDYLMVQLSKFYLGDDWVPKKYGEWLVKEWT